MNEGIELVPVADLAVHPENPRQGDVGAIYESIRANGFYGAIVAQRSTSRILAGNHRYLAAREAGAEEVPVAWVDVDDEAALRILLADNRTNDLASYDDDALARLLVEIRTETGTLDGTGYDGDALDDLLRDLGMGAAPEEDEPDLEPPEDPESKSGEVYELGPHRLVCGDATDAETWAKALDGRHTDFVFTSPPYNVDVQYASYDDRERPVEEYLGFLGEVAGLAYEHLSPGRLLGWNVGVSPRTHPHRHVAVLEEAGFAFWRQYVWAKVGVPVPSWYHTLEARRARKLTSNYTHELVLLVAKGEVKPGERIEVDALLENDVITGIAQAMATRDVPAGPTRSGAGSSINLERRAKKAHPAVFPVALPRAFLTHLAAPGELVVDPFAGSGSTLIACEQMGRVCAALELEPAYCDVVRRRYAASVGDPSFAP